MKHLLSTIKDIARTITANVQRSLVNGQRSMLNVQRSMVNGQRSMLNVQRSMVNGQRLLVNGYWLLVNGYWLTVIGYCLTVIVACGDYLDMDTKEPVEIDSIGLPQRVITMFEGDSYAIPLAVEPDSALAFNSIYLRSENDSVAMFLSDSLLALRQGETKVFVHTATGGLSDSCQVCVVPPLWMEQGLYPYDMVIYAAVNVHGTKITRENADMYPVGAYVHNELRGIGQMHQAGGVDYMVIRVWSPFEGGEKVVLRCYQRPDARCELFPDTLTFDGERHGTLSDLYPLTIGDNAEVWPSSSTAN